MTDFHFKRYNNKFIKESDYDRYNDINKEILEEFENGDLKQWLSVDTYVSSSELEDLKKCALDIRNKCDVFVVIGIGGSYMGSKALIEAFLTRFVREKPLVIFLGKSLNPNEYVEKINFIKDKDICVNVISKSGTTLEPSVAFDLIMEVMEEKYSEDEIKDRVYVTTDSEDGRLRSLVNEKGYKSFVVPRTVGGRFSVFTPVGLLPVLVDGHDVDALLRGVSKGMDKLDVAFEYAMVRDIMYNSGKRIENYSIYDEKLIYFAEWLKQLYGETQGKDGKGIFPVTIVNTRDLHSLGQFLQEGTNIVFETVIGIKNNMDIMVKEIGKGLNEINNTVLDRVCEAHYNGYTPSSIIMLEEMNEENLGELMQIFMMSAIIGARYLDVNPFDQPGVQEYKKLVSDALRKNN